MTLSDQAIWDRWNASRHLTSDERWAAIEAADLAEAEHAAEYVRVGDHDEERRRVA